MIPQVCGFQGCYLDNHRNNWRCARAVPALCENAPCIPQRAMGGCTRRAPSAQACTSPTVQPLPLSLSHSQRPLGASVASTASRPASAKPKAHGRTLRPQSAQPGAAGPVGARFFTRLRPKSAQAKYADHTTLDALWGKAVARLRSLWHELQVCLPLGCGSGTHGALPGRTLPLSVWRGLVDKLHFL